MRACVRDMQRTPQNNAGYSSLDYVGSQFTFTSAMNKRVDNPYYERKRRRRRKEGGWGRVTPKWYTPVDSTVRTYPRIFAMASACPAPGAFCTCTFCSCGSIVSSYSSDDIINISRSIKCSLRATGIHWRAHRNFARAFRIDYQTVGGATTWTAMLQTAGSWCLAACALLAFFCSQVISSEPKYVRIMHLIPSSCPVSINNTYSIQSLFPTKKKTPNVYFASLLFCVRASITNPPSTIVLPTASNRTRPP